MTQIEERLRAQFANIPVALDKMGDAVVALIKRRTSQGQFLEGSHDVGKNKVGTYDPAYARRKKGGRPSPVTLIDTGAMLGSLGVVEASSDLGFESRGRGSKFFTPMGGGRRAFAAIPESFSTTIGFADPTMAKRARYHDSEATPRNKMPRRHFLGISDSESAELFNKVFVAEVNDSPQAVAPNAKPITLTISLG